MAVWAFSMLRVLAYDLSMQYMAYYPVHEDVCRIFHRKPQPVWNTSQMGTKKEQDLTKHLVYSSLK